MPLTEEEFKALAEVIPTACDIVSQKGSDGKVRRVFVDMQQVLTCLSKCVKKGSGIIGTDGNPLLSEN